MVSSATARAASPAEAPPPAPGTLDGGRTLSARRASHAPTIDGALDDEVWRETTPVDGFGQQVPKTGQPPSMATVVRLAYDADRLYLAIECRDPEPGRIAAPLTRRDRAVEGDWIAMEIDSLGDRKTAFGFGVYASNVQFDYLRSGDNVRDYDWDAVWISATQVDEQGWTAELAIPLKALRFTAAPAVSFRVEIDRYVSRLGETDQLVVQPPSEQGALLRMATLTGLEGVSQGYGLELRPFVLTSLDHRHSPGPAYDPPSGNHARFSAGGELSYRVRNDLVVDGTVLPDFGQVEADQVILNLSTFETFFPEKRPFFLSGADLFALHDHLGSPTETQLFYSRRIGQVPGSLELPSGARIVDQPAAAEIWGAAKLTGRVSDHVSVAVLDAVTRQQDATIQAADGSRRGILVSPLSNFAVARLRAELPAGFAVGAMATDVARHDLASVGAADCSGTTTAHCASDAATGGVDATWSSADGEWVGAASMVASRMIAGPTHAVPDGTTIRPGDSGLGGQLALAKAGGEHWLADLKYEGYSRKLDLNEAGYLRRSNLSQITTDLDYRTTEPWALTRKTDNVLMLKAWDTIDGVRLVRLVALSTAVELENFWGFTAELDYAPAMQDNRELRDGTPYERPYLIMPVIGLHSDARKAVSFSALASLGNQLRGYQYSADATVLLRLSQRFELSLLPHLDRSFGDPRWVVTEGAGDARSYRFGDLDARSASLTLRGIFTFNPNLTLQAYALGFVAAAHYGPYYAANAGSGQVRLQDLHAAAAPTSNPDFKDGNININVALRWEYRPGSTLFVVYSRAQTIGDPTADQSPTRPDYRALQRGPSDDVVLLKLSYWFGT
jgi:hypothetical protein